MRKNSLRERQNWLLYKGIVVDLDLSTSVKEGFNAKREGVSLDFSKTWRQQRRLMPRVQTNRQLSASTPKRSRREHHSDDLAYFVKFCPSKNGL